MLYDYEQIKNKMFGFLVNHKMNKIMYEQKKKYTSVYKCNDTLYLNWDMGYFSTCVEKDKVNIISFKQKVVHFPLHLVGKCILVTNPLVDSF